jgi:outer membrane protein OmpA-like peptidoglycan-associated protein
MRVFITAAVAALCLAMAGGARADDVEGARDHPLIKRYEDAIIIGYRTSAFGEFDIATGPHRSFDATLTERQTVEGALTRILYVAPEGRSTLEIFRNYRKELTDKGFTAIFECKGAECGAGPDVPRAGSTIISRALLPRAPLENMGKVTQYAFSEPQDVRYLSAKLDRPEGAVYVSLAVAIEGFEQFPQTAKRALVLLDVVETGEMEQRMVLVEADAMAKALAETGRIALYGIYFDTDSAAIKPESKETLDEIAKLLNADMALKLYVVGHTDNKGAYDHNMSLSARRAESVVAALTGERGIAASRLKSAGVGLLAPVAANESEDGRALNRRVELVRQ